MELLGAMGLHMLTMGSARPSEHPNQAQKEAPTNMGRFNSHVLGRDLNEHGHTNGPGNGDHIWHCLHRPVHMDLESPDLLSRRRHILSVLGYLILFLLPQDIPRSCRSFRFHCGANFLRGQHRGVRQRSFGKLLGTIQSSHRSTCSGIFLPPRPRGQT